MSSSNKSRSRSRSRSKSKDRYKNKFFGEKSTNIFKNVLNQSQVKQENIGYSEWTKNSKDLEKRGFSINLPQDSNGKNELLMEIERVKQKRAERELEKARQEEERAKLLRNKEEETYDQWREKEEKFHKEQARLRLLSLIYIFYISNICRSKIRIEQSREQPIDILVKILMIFNGELAYDKNIEKEIQEPYIIFQKLGSKELMELSEGIVV